MKAMVIDLSKCNGCYNCQIACKDEHVGNDWSPFAKPQPLTGHFWMKVTDIVRGTVPKVRIVYGHDLCQHCDNPPCLAACKEKAIVKREDGVVLIQPDKCRGERNCMAACPYGAIYFNDDLNIAQKCTFCAHLLDKGAREPRCVGVCPTGALSFGEETDLKALIETAETVDRGNRVGPRVYYIGLPKRFVAGAVYDPSEDECIEGASVTLLNLATNDRRSAATDEFGDFWFEGLQEARYSLLIEKEGYRPCALEDVSTQKDVNVGDIALTKE